MKGSGIKTTALLATGWISLAAGVIGILLPVWPTTPFVLLAAACFVRSSPRLHRWLVGHRLWGGLIAGYLQHRAISRQAKMTAIVSVWLGIGLSVVLLIDRLWLQALLLIIALAVSTHILRLRTLVTVASDNGEKGS